MSSNQVVFLATIIGGGLALGGQLLTNRNSSRLIKFERKYSAYHEFTTVSNRSIRAAQDFLNTVERYHKIETEIEAVRENTLKEERALIAISKIPNSGLEKVLTDFDSGSWESLHSSPSETIRRLIAPNGSPAEPAFESILEKLDSHQARRNQLVRDLGALKEDVTTNKLEFNTCKRELDSALGNIQLSGLPQITLKAQQLSKNISSWSNGDISQKEVEDGFAEFIGMANLDLHESHTKSILNQLLRRKSPYLKVVAKPNLN